MFVGTGGALRLNVVWGGTTGVLLDALARALGCDDGTSLAIGAGALLTGSGGMTLPDVGGAGLASTLDAGVDESENIEP